MQDENENVENLSIEQINELYSEIIEMPDLLGVNLTCDKTPFDSCGYTNHANVQTPPAS